MLRIVLSIVISLLAGCGNLTSMKSELMNRISPCVDWLDQSTVGGRGFNDPMTSIQPLPHLICLNGVFDKTVSLEALKQISDLPSHEHSVIVIRSGGGDIDMALSMAEAMENKNITVVVKDICASSCANYIFLAGRQRVVLKDALLLYHGGVQLDLLEEIAIQLKEALGGDEAFYYQEIERQRQILLSQVKRQSQFLINRSVRKEFFYWIHTINHLSENDALKVCPSSAGMIIFDPSLLGYFGIHIDHYEGPRSARAMESIQEAQFPKYQFCFVNDIKWGLKQGR
jgi:ATP-dependent protease ClpP protease subunit